MRRTRRRDTSCEMAIRRAVHAMGLRYRVDHPLPFDKRRRADLLFTRAKVAVFVDGCFWHGCPEHGTLPKANRSWWREKIDANKRRDADTTTKMREQQWEVVRVWEHENPEEAALRVSTTVARRTRKWRDPGGSRPLREGL
jgi:DNA mismatch endonuclease, patch repair protein